MRNQRVAVRRRVHRHGEDRSQMSHCQPAERELDGTHARHPHLRLELVEDSHHVLLGRFPQHRLGVVPLRESATLPSGARIEPLNEDRIVAIAAPGDALWRAALETRGTAGRDLGSSRRPTR